MAPLHAAQRAVGLDERRGWDLNPRTALRRSAVFKTAPFDRSGTPPLAHRSVARGAQWYFAGACCLGPGALGAELLRRTELVQR
jgi:hypothetical protein